MQRDVSELYLFFFLGNLQNWQGFGLLVFVVNILGRLVASFIGDGCDRIVILIRWRVSATCN